MLGRKSGSGFYKYEGKTQMANAEIEKWRAAPSVIPNEVRDPRNRDRAVPSLRSE